MMLPATGPTTTLNEDMAVLFPSTDQKNLTEEKGPSTSPPQTKEPDDKGGDYAGPPSSKDPKDPGGDVDLETGDGPAGHYTYVPVRGDEDVSPKGKYGGSRGGAKNEHLEQVQVNGKMVPSFMVPSEQEVAEQQEQNAQQAQEDQLTRAWEVINSYFGEDDDGLNEEGLRGVCNAMGFALNSAVEDIGHLQSENKRLTEAVNDLNGILKEAEIAEGYNGKKKNGDDDYADMSKEKDDDDNGNGDDDNGKKKLPPWLSKKDESRGAANLTEDASLNSILDEVANIGQSPEAQAVDTQSKLIDGFEKVVESTTDLVERIIAVIREDAGLAEDEELELDEDNDRVKLARFFYGIAEDAQNYLTRMADGDIAFRVAEEDLARLNADLRKGIEEMQEVE